MAGEPQRACGVGHGCQTGARPVRRDRDGKTGHIQATLSFRQPAGFQPHDVGPILGKDMRQAGYKPKLVAAADRDPVRDLAGLAGRGSNMYGTTRT